MPTTTAATRNPIGKLWTPYRSGFQLVRYASGAVAVVAYDLRRGWEWGTTAPPASQVIGVQNLGEAPRQTGSWQGALTGLPASLQGELTKLFENGTTPEGGTYIPVFGTRVGAHDPTGAIVLDAQGRSMTPAKVSGGSLGGGGAKTLPGETGGNTNPLVNLTGWTWILSLGALKGFGLVLAGAVILFVVGRELVRL